MGYVYKILCEKNGKFYIGSTVNFQSRRRGHLHLLRKGRHHSKYMQRSFNKYGEENFSFFIIKDNINNKDLIDIEARHIKILKPGFNADMPLSTRRGSKQTDACKAKVSAANKGRVVSEEVKAKISARSKGNLHCVGKQNALKVTPEIKSFILKLRLDGVGCRRIAKITGLNKTTILNVFNQKYNYGGLNGRDR